MRPWVRRLLVFMAIFIVLTLVWRVLPGHSWADAMLGGACSLAGVIIGNLIARLVERRRQPAPEAPALPHGRSPEAPALPHDRSRELTGREPVS